MWENPPKKKLGRPDFWQSLLRPHHLLTNGNLENGDENVGKPSFQSIYLGKILKSIPLIIQFIHFSSLTDIEWRVSCWTNHLASVVVPYQNLELYILKGSWKHIFVIAAS